MEVKTMTENKERTVELYFDGEQVPMMPFIEEILYNITKGLVSALKSMRKARKLLLKSSKKRTGSTNENY